MSSPSQRLEQLTAEALTLPPEERARLARALIASLDGDEADDADPTEAESAVRRAEAARRAAHPG
jgi:hypothetical protein